MNRENNFDFLRLIFSLFVIITHSYPLSGLVECDTLCQLSTGQIHFSYIGVRGFFIISGFLVFQSLMRSSSIFSFYKKRVLRIFPALIVTLFFTLIIIAIIYQNRVPAIWQEQSFRTYFFNNLSLYKVQYIINGVFESNPYKYGINGSLWTLAYEFSFYILLSTLFFIRSKTMLVRYIVWTTTVLSIIVSSFFSNIIPNYTYYLNTISIIELLPYFLCGGALATIEIEKLKRQKTLILMALFVLILSLYFDFFESIKYLTLPILVIYIGISSTPYLNIIGKKIGDISYGIYLYGFVVQQVLQYYFRLSLMPLIIYSSIITIAIALLSWNLVEKPMLKLK